MQILNQLYTSWQNGTRCRDGVKVLWCRSHLVLMVLRGPSHLCLFHSENVFVTCSRCFFVVVVVVVVVLRNSKREERWEGRPRGRYMV